MKSLRLGKSTSLLIRLWKETVIERTDPKQRWAWFILKLEAVVAKQFLVLSCSKQARKQINHIALLRHVIRSFSITFLKDFLKEWQKG